ncbi:hypothetical protein [Pollutibacter soli]|uniref:hypothetical protein n=1 Tax=Pollutibacter soli TaxID=3034157 RepID=UPI003013C140
MKKITLIFTLLVAGLGVAAQQKADGPYISSQIEKGAPYTLVLLTASGGQPPKDSAMTWHTQHLQNLFQLHLDKKISVFGPVTAENPDGLSGIIIFNSSDENEIKKWLGNDPMISKGIMLMKFYKWFSIPGQTLLNTK